MMLAKDVLNFAHGSVIIGSMARHYSRDFLVGYFRWEMVNGLYFTGSVIAVIVA
jgi:hypothetical protein